jgi:uncharacterized protein YjbI with pentapeptide repeats
MANLSGAFLPRADMSRTNLVGADLTDAKVSQEQLNDAITNGSTKVTPPLKTK